MQDEYKDLTDEALLKEGLHALDKAIGDFMCLQSPEGKALAHMVYSAYIYAENTFLDIEKQ